MTLVARKICRDCHKPPSGANWLYYGVCQDCRKLRAAKRKMNNVECVEATLNAIIEKRDATARLLGEEIWLVRQLEEMVPESFDPMI